MGQSKRVRIVSIILRFNSRSGQGYALVECVIRRLSVPSTSTEASICAIVDIPVDSISGRPVFLNHLSSATSVNAADGILYPMGSNHSMKSTAVSSQHDANHSMERLRQYSMSAPYCSTLNSIR